MMLFNKDHVESDHDTQVSDLGLIWFIRSILVLQRKSHTWINKIKKVGLFD